MFDDFMSLYINFLEVSPDLIISYTFYINIYTVSKRLILLNEMISIISLHVKTSSKWYEKQRVLKIKCQIKAKLK